ncbi:hypothetical protein YYC_05596 [Plasmodium yoelii 17X]|uniref:Uncharacterized protein n=1 Tax=Plasmodium yoelii 17X TaxID=1323249 RepID=V7PA70_PLAYE|nr:hypothetical protein YYC_05596 [Plasmodium yoelii 17X]
MNDDLCGKIGFLREYLPDDLDKNTSLDFYGHKNFQKYCPRKNCHNDLEKITIGFLWLLEQYFTEYPNKGDVINDTKPFFIYIILWLSYKLNKNTEHKTDQINDFYTENVIGNNKYSTFIEDSNRFTNIKGFINKQKDLLNVDIKDLSKFYDASKLICSMYGNVAQGQTGDILSNNVKEFVKKYTELNNKYSNEDTELSKILSALSTDYNNLKNRCKHIQSLPEITEFSALASTYEVISSSSSTGNKLFTVLSIFGAIAFFLGISYKVNNKELKKKYYIYANINKENYSLFGFRKRFKKQQIREKIKNIKKKMAH